MPLFTFEAPPTEQSRYAAAIDLAMRRFPEVSVETRRIHDTGEQWVCRAPSASHVDRWGEAAELSLRAVDASREGGRS
jgi:hypothetical protein